MVEAKFLKPDTLALHAGQHPDPVTGARAVPIYQTTSYVFRDVDHAASLFNLEVGGHIYSRISNPTVAVFEERVAALEEGSGALGVASGQAALHIAIATLMGTGGHIVQVSTSLVEHAIQAVPAVLASLSKGACVAATRGLAMELAADNLRVNAVSLGIIRTPLHDPASLEGKKAFAPLNRYGEVSDVVRAVMYLEDSDFVTGDNVLESSELAQLAAHHDLIAVVPEDRAETSLPPG